MTRIQEIREQHENAIGYERGSSVAPANVAYLLAELEEAVKLLTASKRFCGSRTHEKITAFLAKHTKDSQPVPTKQRGSHKGRQ